MKKDILYYPYINLPKTDWTLRTLLYYDTIGSIVPQEFFLNPDGNYKGFMKELVRESLVILINPITVLNNPERSMMPFLDTLSNDLQRLTLSQTAFSISISLKRKGNYGLSSIYGNKFDKNIFDGLVKLGLAKQERDDKFVVEYNTASSLMLFLATLIGAKTKRLPITDRAFDTATTIFNENNKREAILTELMPFPEDIDLKKLLGFKEKHYDLLDTFRTKIELLVLDTSLIIGTPLFELSVKELKQRKEELSARMQEFNFKEIAFATVSGIMSAYPSLEVGDLAFASLAAIPPFALAIKAALRIEQAENIFDQSGMKYLALAENKIYRKKKVNGF